MQAYSNQSHDMVRFFTELSHAIIFAESFVRVGIGALTDYFMFKIEISLLAVENFFSSSLWDRL